MYEGDSIKRKSRFTMVEHCWKENDTLIEKINKIAKKIYRASEVTMDDNVKAQIANLQKNEAVKIQKELDKFELKITKNSIENK